MCKTRWSEGDISYERIYLEMLHIMEALEIMNEAHYNMPFFADTIQKVGVPEINKEHPHISIHYVTFSI